MRSGTRRMWSRRVLRAGWLIAPIFSAPTRVYKAVFCDNDEGKFEWSALFAVAFVAFVVTCFGFLVHDMATHNNPASPERIARALKYSPCMDTLIPQRAQEKGTEPLTNRDLDHAFNDCDKVSDDYYAKLEQQKVLDAQAAVIGGKK